MLRGRGLEFWVCSGFETGFPLQVRVAWVKRVLSGRGSGSSEFCCYRNAKSRSQWPSTTKRVPESSNTQFVNKSNNCLSQLIVFLFASV